MVIFPDYFLVGSLLEYRKAIDICILILYPAATALNLFIPGAFWWVFMERSIPSADENSLTSFPPTYLTFLSFFCQIVLAKVPSTVLNRSGDSAYLCLLPNVGGKALGFSPFSLI